MGGLDWNLIAIVQLIALIYWAGDGRKEEVTHSSKRTGRKGCVERFSVSLQIYKNENKNKKKARLSNKNDYFFYLAKSCIHMI